jgi:protein O-mannosyl-transferase
MIAGNENNPRPWLIAAGMAIAVVLVYWNSLQSPFLFDDTGAVLNNPTIRKLWSLSVLKPPADGSTTTGRPFVNLSFAINHAISGERVWSYHALNILIHVLAAWTLMGVVRRTLRLETVGSALPTKTAAAAAFWWALHPMQSETVVCIAQRTESLCALLYLLTLYCFVRGMHREEPAAPHEKSSQRTWLAASIGACLFGMATKEVMVTAPVLILIYDRTFIAGTMARALRERWLYYAGLAGTWIPLAGLVMLGGGARGSAAGFGLGVTWWSYLLEQARGLVIYLRLSLWPYPLILDYGSSTAESVGDVWWQLLVVLVLLGVTGWMLVRQPKIGFLLTAFFLILAPSSSVVPLVTQTIAEHRMYLPLAALIVAATFVVFRWLEHRSQWMLAAAAVALAGVTVARTQDYRTVISIWTDTITKVPRNARAHNNLGWALQQRGEYALANRHFARAVELQPEYVSAHYSWGVALLEQNRPADAVAPLMAAVRIAPQHADAHVNLGNALTRTQRTAEAVAHYERALELKPGGDVHYNLGVALGELGRTDEAAAHLKTALRLQPQLHEASFQLGRLAERGGRLSEAEAHYSEILRLAPDHADAHAKLGLLLARAGRLDSAAEHFRAVIRVRPDDADAHANLGNVLLLQSRPREAIASYEAALRLRPDDSRTRENIRLAREALR